MRHTLILGCGYIGSALAASWKQREFELTLTTTSPSRVAELGPLADRVLLLDATQKASTVQALANVDTLIVTLAPSKPGSSYRAIYLDTARAIAQAVHAGAPIKQIVYTGSASVYNDSDGAWVTEDHPLAPKEERQAVLIEAERCLLELAKGSTHVCVLRLGEIYGPERDPAQRLRKLAGQTLPGDGLNITNLIHRDDVVSAICFAIEKQLSGVYNLCNSTHMTRAEFYHMLCSNLGLPEPQWDPSQKSPHGGKRKLSCERIQSLGFTWKHPLFNPSALV